ncbi:MAG: malto-oligosyltrehalose synthase [Cyanobacteria bacterium P01_D01_bin.56]
MRIPVATYRLQFNPDFRFTAAQEIVDYLAMLGVSDIYASPIFKARSGSSHGYDVVDQNQLNPELGSDAEFDRLVNILHERGMGWLQDIVPNHMAYSGENHYLMDVLEHGADSAYFNYFDVEWDTGYEEIDGRVLAPLLGDFYDRCLERGEIQLTYDRNGLSVCYYGLKFPIRIESYGGFLSHNIKRLVEQLGKEDRTYIKVSGLLYLVKDSFAGLSGKQRQDQTRFVKELLWELYQGNSDIQEFIQQNLDTFNGIPGQPESYNLLDDLLSDQFYRLAFWKVGAEELNYRRFFTVNELICLKVDDLEVFNQTHALTQSLVKADKINGLRIDHIDGLYDPTEYLSRLRETMGDTYIVIEKILELEEDLPEAWPIQGTSGYEFLNYLNGVFCQSDNESDFTRIYHQLTGQTAPYQDLFLAKKRLMAETNLVGDIDNLARFLKRISSQYRYGRDLTLYGLRTAIEEVLIAFPIYCTYINEAGVTSRALHYISIAIERARQQIPQLVTELNLIEKFLRLEYEDSLPVEERAQWLHFVMRLQQFTGPLMAKGIEDTLFYSYNRLLSLNEVGGSPDHFGISPRQFHRFNQQQQAQWPQAMNASSTHDTKRSEDVRARLNVLSEIPHQWETKLQTWRSLNGSHKRVVNDQVVPDANDEYFLYQTLVGVMPFDTSDLGQVTERVTDYVVKAVREAKVHTAWLRPDTDYEQGFVEFTKALLTGENAFLEDLREFQATVADYGIYNALSQVLLKMMSPGVPDIYQGNEMWDFSLVDPDNRRPVDYGYRRHMLNEIKRDWENAPADLLPNLLEHRQDGRIKLFVVHRSLGIRHRYSDLFRSGSYMPLMAHGAHEDNIIAFARQWQSQTVVVVAPRFLTQVAKPGTAPTGPVWQDTTLTLPQSGTWYDWLSDRTLDLSDEVAISELLSDFPLALLVQDASV